MSATIAVSGLRATPVASTSRFTLGARPAARPAVIVRAVADVDETSFQAEAMEPSNSGPVLVDFWATWCGPCKLVAPLMKWADETYPNLTVCKVEADPCPKLVEQYKVYGLPALVILKNGEVVAKHEGAISKAKLQDWLEKNGVAA